MPVHGRRRKAGLIVVPGQQLIRNLSAVVRHEGEKRGYHGRRDAANSVVQSLGPIAEMVRPGTENDVVMGSSNLL